MPETREQQGERMRKTADVGLNPDLYPDLKTVYEAFGKFQDEVVEVSKKAANYLYDRSPKEYGKYGRRHLMIMALSQMLKNVVNHGVLIAESDNMLKEQDKDCKKFRKRRGTA
jgi:hypothetical protein